MLASLFGKKKEASEAKGGIVHSSPAPHPASPKPAAEAEAEAEAEAAEAPSSPDSPIDIGLTAKDVLSPRSVHRTLTPETLHRREKAAFRYAVAITWFVEQAKDEEEAGYSTECFFFETKDEASQCKEVAGYTEKSGDYHRRMLSAVMFTRKGDEWNCGALGGIMSTTTDFGHNMSKMTMKRGASSSELKAAVQAAFDEESEMLVTVGTYPKLDFNAIQPGDVLLMNTNGIPIPGKLIAPRSPAGKLGMKHTALVLDAPFQSTKGKPTPKGGGALTWEMFEYSGAKIRALQGSERTPDQMLKGREFTEEPNPVDQNQLMIIRYVGPDREEAVARVQEVIRLWDNNKANIEFPGYAGLWTKNLTPHWYAATPDAKARSYAQYVRTAMANGGKADADALFADDSVQYCSSLVAASWQAALGSLSEEANSEQETELLTRCPMHAQWAKPSDWSLLPNRSPYWKIMGVVTGYSEKRSFNWYNP